MNALTLGLLAQIAIPNPVGYVNDFAHVIDAGSQQQMETMITEVRQKTRGDIAVVTLPDIGDRSEVDVAVQIGRQWGVGGQGAAGDPAKNLGVVILVVPRKNHQPGTGKIFIDTGRGAEGFLTDMRAPDKFATRCCRCWGARNMVPRWSLRSPVSRRHTRRNSG
jgi:uncharacterized protein